MQKHTHIWIWNTNALEFNDGIMLNFSVFIFFFCFHCEKHKKNSTFVHGVVAVVKCRRPAIQIAINKFFLQTKNLNRKIKREQQPKKKIANQIKEMASFRSGKQ